MQPATEEKLREVYGDLAPSPTVREHVMEAISMPRRPASRRLFSLAGPLAVAACLLLAVGIWLGSGPGTEDRILLRFFTGNQARPPAPIMTARLHAYGIEDATARAVDEGRGVEVLVPRTAPLTALVALLTRPGNLEFRIVAEDSEPLDPGEYRIAADDAHGGPLYFLRVPADRGEDFRGTDLDPESIEVRKGPTARWCVLVEMKEGRREAFRAFTRANIGRRMAIVVDGRVESAPVIMDALPGAMQIDGGGPSGFSREQARALAAVLRSGPYAGEVRPAERK